MSSSSSSSTSSLSFYYIPIEYRSAIISTKEDPGAITVTCRTESDLRRFIGVFKSALDPVCELETDEVSVKATIKPEKHEAGVSAIDVMKLFHSRVADCQKEMEKVKDQTFSMSGLIRRYLNEQEKLKLFEKIPVYEMNSLTGNHFEFMTATYKECIELRLLLDYHLMGLCVMTSSTYRRQICVHVDESKKATFHEKLANLKIPQDPLKVFNLDLSNISPPQTPLQGLQAPSLQIPSQMSMSLENAPTQMLDASP